jgi:hypothetical protein
MATAEKKSKYLVEVSNEALELLNLEHLRL